MDSKDATDVIAVLEGDDATARGFLRLISHPADLVEALRVVDVETWPRLLRLVDDIELRSELVAYLDEDEREDLLAGLSPDEIAGLIRELESDDQADVVGALEPAEQKLALGSLPADERAAVEQLLTYPEDSAGGIMQVERAEVNVEDTLAVALEKVRSMVEDGYEVHRVYVVDEGARLVGSFDIADLVLHRPHVRVRDIVEPTTASVTPDVDQEEVAAMFRKYGLVALPVVAHDGRLLGRIVIDDIVDVLEEEAEEDALRMAGTDAEELLYRDRAIPIARVRLPWIGINLIGSMVSAFLLHLYEPVFEQVLIIAAFVPVITAMGGNVGTQSATILTRGFATGRIELSEIPRVAFKELRVGLLMGTLCGVVVGLIAAFLFGGGRLYLGVVVGLAMVCAMSTAAVVGAVAPAALKRLGIDPAIAAGPFVTTANDIIGIVIYMSMALAFLEKLR